LTGLLVLGLNFDEVLSAEPSPSGPVPMPYPVTTTAMPDWVKITSGFWANGDISDTEYVNAIEYLLKERIMTVPSTVQTAEGQEITQSIEVLEQRIDTIESFDKEKFEEILAIEDPVERKKVCDVQPGIIDPLCEVAFWLLEKITEEDENEQKIQQEVSQQLGIQIQKAEVLDLDEPPAIPAGATGTYVKYKKGVTENSRLTVMCDPGDVATGGGFMPVIELEMSYHASMPYPTNYANNPRMNNPTGWTFYSLESGEARVWVVCLDLTPSALSANTIP